MDKEKTSLQNVLTGSSVVTVGLMISDTADSTTFLLLEKTLTC